MGNKLKYGIIPSVVFVFSSIILFVNNLTQFFENFGMSSNINIITWIGIMFSIIWWMYIFGKNNKMW